MILLPAHAAPAPFTILATLLLVLIPDLFGLSTVVTAPPSKSTKANVPVSKSIGIVGPVTTGGVPVQAVPTSYLMYFVTD